MALKHCNPWRACRRYGSRQRDRPGRQFQALRGYSAFLSYPRHFSQVMPWRNGIAARSGRCR